MTTELRRNESSAKTNAERQREYRRRRSTAGPDGNGERKINTWVPTGSALALERLARRYGITRREMLMRLITDADNEIMNQLDIDSPQWGEYFGQ